MINVPTALALLYGTKPYKAFMTHPEPDARSYSRILDRSIQKFFTVPSRHQIADDEVKDSAEIEASMMHYSYTDANFSKQKIR